MLISSSPFASRQFTCRLHGAHGRVNMTREIENQPPGGVSSSLMLHWCYLMEASSNSGTSTRRLQATRSPSVAIWLRGALLCIWRTPSICPLRRKPTLGGEWTSVGEPTDPEVSKCKIKVNLKKKKKNCSYRETTIAVLLFLYQSMARTHLMNLTYFCLFL